jgi:hypothetical protein
LVYYCYCYYFIYSCRSTALSALDWREEKQINTICDRKLDKRADFKTAWTTVVTGRDPQGRYIAVDRLGEETYFCVSRFFVLFFAFVFCCAIVAIVAERWYCVCVCSGNINPSDLMKKFNVDELQMHHTQNQEFLAKMKEELFEKEGKRLYKVTQHAS